MEKVCKRCNQLSYHHSKLDELCSHCEYMATDFQEMKYDIDLVVSIMNSGDSKKSIKIQLKELNDS